MKRFCIRLMAATALGLIATSLYGEDRNLKDEDTCKLLVGKWVQEKQMGKAIPVSTKVVMVVKKDNTFVMDGKGKIDDAEKSSDFKFSGTWKVIDGKLAMTVKTISASSGVPVKEGAVFVQTVIEIDDTTLKTNNERDKGKGYESVWKRAKD